MRHADAYPCRAPQPDAWGSDPDLCRPAPRGRRADQRN